MRVDDHGSAALATHAGSLACTVLDAGPFPIARGEFAAVIRSILTGRVGELARDRNAICYRVHLSGRDGATTIAIVKAPRPGPQRTNADATFAWEAEVLATLPATGITDGPALLARVAAAGRHFLFTTEVPGKHPDPRFHPLDGRQLRAILDGLCAMDRLGFMHYDLKAANILVDGDRAGFIDFEFARFEGCDDAYAPAKATHCADFNVSVNPLFPARSNVANFEFRAFHRYLGELGAAQSAAAEDALLRDWLRVKSVYHQRMAEFLTELAGTSSERFATHGGITRDDARCRLRAAAAHESLLAALLEDPHGAVARIERALMAYRCAVFERRAPDAHRQHRATLTEIEPAAAHARSLPDAYRRATLRVLDLVGRSVHPRP